MRNVTQEIDCLTGEHWFVGCTYMYISGQLWQNICVPKMPILSLPEHPSASVGQSLFSCDNPKQSSPPFAGGGLVQVRVRVLNPWRQRVGSVHVVQAVQVVNTPSTAPAKKKIESPISFSTLKVFHFVLILFFSFFLIFAWISFYDDLLFMAYSFHSIPTLFLLEWDWNMRLGGERLCIPRTYHNRSHNRERRPLVLGSAGTYEMGQFLYFFGQFASSWRHISALIHAHVVGSRVDVVTFRDQMVRVERFSCRFFTAMAGNKAGKKNQGSSMHFYALS